MTRIRLYAHPIASAPQFFDAPSIGEWLLDHYGDAPVVGVQVFAGEPSTETDITGDIDALVANAAPEYVVLQRPGTDPYTWFQVIVVVFSVASALMATSPTMPANVNRTQQSPNNGLGSRENQVRMLQRVEDIFGTVRAVPSMMMPTYYKYIDNDKYEHGYYCVSLGYIDASVISDGDSLLSNITGSSAAVYAPFTSPNSGTPLIQIGTPIIDKVLTVARANEIDGPALRPLNELQFTAGEKYFFVADPGGDIIRQDHRAPNFNSILSPGDQIVVTGTSGVFDFDVSVSGDHTGSGFAGDFLGVVPPGGGPAPNLLDPFLPGDTLVVSSTVNPVNNGTYTIVSISDTFLGVTPAPTTTGAGATHFHGDISFNGTYSIAGVADGYVILTTTTFRAGIFSTIVPIAADIVQITLDPITEYTDWVTLPDPARTEIWSNMVAPQGLNKDNGGMSSVTVTVEFEIEKLDPGTFAPTGIVEIVTSSLTGSVTDEVADTVEHATAWIGAARIRARRTSQHDFDFAGRVTDEIKWADLYSVTPTGFAHFGNKTTIHTVTQATSRSTAVKTRQLNCIASRLIPTFDGVGMSGAFDATGRLVSGTIGPSSKIVDIIAAVTADRRIGNRDISTDLDMAQMYGAQQALDAWSTEAGQFNYTLDTDNVSFEETVQMIANAGFCIAYRQNGKIRLARDRPQSDSARMFTHRNKKPKAETLTRTFANDGDWDGVEFTYMDPDSNQQETIKIPADGSARLPKKFEIPGIRSFTQAWYRANREYYKILGQRLSIELGTTLDARALLPNQRIDIVDNTKFKSFDGEVVGQSGLILTLSREVEFTPGEPHSIVLQRRDGTIEGIPVSPGTSSRKVILSRASSETIVTTPSDEGIRTSFSFGSDSTRPSIAYLIREIDLSDVQYAKITAVNYSDDYYQADSLPVPDKAGIIN